MNLHEVVSGVTTVYCIRMTDDAKLAVVGENRNGNKLVVDVGGKTEYLTLYKDHTVEPCRNPARFGDLLFWYENAVTANRVLSAICDPEEGGQER